MRRSSLLAVIALILLVAPAGADLVTPVSQTRTLTTTAFASDPSGSDSDAENDSAPDFLLFDSAASALVLLGGAIGSGTASQESEILANSIRAQGSHSANGEGWDTDSYGDGSGSSHCLITFDLTEDADYTLTGFLEEYDSGGTSFQLTGPGGTVLALYPPHNLSMPVNESGSLTAGQYTFDVRTSGSAFGGEFWFDYASGAYDLVLQLTTATGLDSFAGADRVAGAAPNPFRSATRISWSRGVDRVSEIALIDVTGRRVQSFRPEPTAEFVEWDGSTATGARVPAGVYFARVSGTGGSETIRIIRLR